MRDHQKIPIENFYGYYNRGNAEACPPNHFQTCGNMQFIDKEVQTRYGTALNFSTITNIVRIELYRRINEAPRLLILNNQGSLYDSTSPGSPILTIANMADFRMVVFFNRAYITPIGSNKQGLSGEKIYVYDGTTIRAAAGAKPAGTPIVIVKSLSSGHIEAGWHLYAIVYETTSGFYTKPGPDSYTPFLVRATLPGQGFVGGGGEPVGGYRIDVSNIPIGPTGTAKRHLISTKAIGEDVWDGNYEDKEFFFVPDGTIEDNVTTTLSAISFYDADLVDSTDYLFDQYEVIPSGACVGEYKGRLVVGKESYIYVSRPGEPESINSLSGLILVDPTESSYVKNFTEFRDSLYIDKETSSYVTSDNGLDPTTWPVLASDKGAGSALRGTVKILNKQGSSFDKFLTLSRRGVLLFDGLYREPALTWKIEKVWDQITPAYFDLVHGINDPITGNIYIAIPWITSYCNVILMGNYDLGLDHQNIRWSIWSFPWNPVSILIDLNNNVPYLRIASSAGVYDVNSSSRLDAAQAITSSVSTGYQSLEPGYLNHFASVRLRVQGNGTLTARLNSQDAARYQNLMNTSLYSAPGKDITLLSNFTAEKCFIDLQTNAADSWFSLKRLDLFAKVLWSSWPL